MSKTIKIEKKLMLDILDNPDKIISDTIERHGRWSVHHELIFVHQDGNFYRTYYSKGATENQDEYPWEYEDEVGCTLVIPVQKVVTVYEDAP